MNSNRQGKVRTMSQGEDLYLFAIIDNGASVCCCQQWSSVCFRPWSSVTHDCLVVVAAGAVVVVVIV
jgi:hypothetical protein